MIQRYGFGCINRLLFGKRVDGDYVLYADHLVVLAEKDKQIAALTTERDLMKKCLFPEQLKIIQSN